MRGIVSALVVSLFLLLFVAAPAGKPGCSSPPAPPKGEGGNAAEPVPVPPNRARRDAPPLVAPGDAPPKVKPMTLKDEASGTLFYFESDGQHVTALDKDGNVLWHKNPVTEAGLKGFSKGGKTAWPTICHAGPVQERALKVMRDRGKTGGYIAVSVSTKEFGLLDKQTGEFTLMGSD